MFKLNSELNYLPYTIIVIKNCPETIFLVLKFYVMYEKCVSKIH